MAYDVLLKPQVAVHIDQVPGSSLLSGCFSNSQRIFMNIKTHSHEYLIYAVPLSLNTLIQAQAP